MILYECARLWQTCIACLYRIACVFTCISPVLYLFVASEATPSLRDSSLYKLQWALIYKKIDWWWYECINNERAYFWREAKKAWMSSCVKRRYLKCRWNPTDDQLCSTTVCWELQKWSFYECHCICSRFQGVPAYVREWRCCISCFWSGCTKQ